MLTNDTEKFRGFIAQLKETNIILTVYYDETKILNDKE